MYARQAALTCPTTGPFDRYASESGPIMLTWSQCIPCNSEESAMKPPRCRRLLYLSRIVVTIGFAIALAAPTRSDAAEIKVLTTRAMNHVLTELGGAFERPTGHKVTLILAPPTEIVKRVVDGEIVDVVMSGAAVNNLVQQGKIAPRDRMIP